MNRRILTEKVENIFELRKLASMEEISTSSRALATLAQELQGAVAKFRV